MALTKLQVKQARDNILNRMQYPSVDAIRIELGNTGSKTTIHKYLKELEIEEGDFQSSAITISEKLQNFVAQLAGQLHLEADERVNALNVSFEKKQNELAADYELLKNSNDQTNIELVQAMAEIKSLRLQLENTAQELQQEHMSRQKHEQHAQGLIQQLKQSEQHRQDLLAKFNHAQQSLDHYRDSVKEQRQQELRRHDSAIQYLQNEIRQLQQTIVVEKQKSHQLENTLNDLESKHSQDQQKISELEHDLLSLKDQNQKQLTEYEKVLSEYNEHKTNTHKMIEKYKVNLQLQKNKLDQYHDYEVIKQQNISLITENKLIQKMYNDLVLAFSHSNKQKDK